MSLNAHKNGKFTTKSGIIGGIFTDEKAKYTRKLQERRLMMLNNALIGWIHALAS